MIKPTVIGLAVFALLMGIFIVHHDYGKPEDDRIIWICQIQGNRKCG